ncbi:MAG: 16S rRNA (cytosine(967)-C(5))-methyltransferase RsmB [Verrucomicrobia bacterium]|nr:16S rRNA (cytosine(967)-C(5))-methyltransferase RsmB [Verrucomicrobiota bacterium]
MRWAKPREIAVRVLLRREHTARFVEDLMDTETARHPLAPPDRRLLQELVCGVVRRQITLDWLIARKTTARPQKPGLRILLRLGLYQLFWLDRVPDHAAVHETVELAKQFGFGPQAAFVNAVLRGYARARAATKALLEELKQTQPDLGHSHPAWLCERWEQRWGRDPLLRLLEWNNTPPSSFARVNSLKTDPTQLAARWEHEGVKVIPRAWDWTGQGFVYELEACPALDQVPSFQDGLFYVQDPSTLLAVQDLDPQPGECVLDLCAAPGGKTTHLAQRMQNRGRIVACDLHPDRLELLRDNCARLGATIVESALTSQLEEPAGEPGFDRVLVDAPCSNTGVMRRRVELRWRLRPEEIERLSGIQLDLLCQAARRLKRGGTLVYSTCSLEPEENDAVIQKLLADHREFRLEHERLLLPFVDGMDGAYVARLTRVAR